MISEQVFQSTHPCGVRLEAVDGRPQLHKVSIHAPLRGATQLSRPGGLFAQVSIHAPLRGATLRQYTQRLRDSVSIHAPLRGAT